MRTMVLCHCFGDADPDPDCEFCGGFGEVEVDDSPFDASGALLVEAFDASIDEELFGATGAEEAHRARV